MYFFELPLNSRYQKTPPMNARTSIVASLLCIALASFPEELLSELVTAAKLKEVKALGLKPDAYQRRISDGFTTCQWVDDDTIVAAADSTSSILVKDKDGEDSVDVTARFRCTLKLDPKAGTWEILKSKKLKEE